MFAPAHQLAPLTIGKAAALGHPRTVSIGAILILCVYVVAGLIWLVVGPAVMRGAPAPRIRHLL